MHRTWKAEQGPLGRSNMFVNSDETLTDTSEARWDACGLQVPPLPELEGGEWGRGWVCTYWWEIRPAGDTESKLMREQKGFKKEGVKVMQMGDSALRRCWWAQMGGCALQWPRTQVAVPVSRLAFHVARLLIANFNRNNNKKHVMEPESFRAKKNVIKKLKFKLLAACKHSLTACEQHFSQKTCPLL